MAAQTELAGIEPATEQTPAAANELPRFAVNGRLVTHALARVRPGPRVVVEALIEQRAEHHPQALRVLCRHQVADEGSFADTQAAAAHLVRHLHAGAEVMVVGRGLEIRQHMGQDVLCPLHCDGIGSIDAADRRVS